MLYSNVQEERRKNSTDPGENNVVSDKIVAIESISMRGTNHNPFLKEKEN